MIPLPIPGPQGPLTSAVAIALAMLLALWILPAGFAFGLFRLVRLLVRLTWWMIVRPKLGVPLLALGLFTWLAWPALGHLDGVASSATPLVVLGVLGALACLLLVGRGLMEQRRINRELEADQYPVDDELTAEARALPEWARE